MKKLGIAILIIVLLLIAACSVILVFDLHTQITINGNEQETVEFGTEYKDKGAEAHLVDDWFNQSMILPMETTGEVDTNKLGTYKIKYATKFLYMTEEKEKTITVIDTKAPIITLVEQTDETLSIPNEPFIEVGFTAIDECDGDLTTKVESKEENGVVYYSVKDNSGNESKIERVIKYKDITSPTLKLVGDKNQTIKLNGVYNELGYIAEDDIDGDLSNNVEIKNNIDVSKPGIYEVIYTIKDKSGNKTSDKRVITILNEDQTNPSNTVVNDGEPNGKNIYLTFDDGPGKYTQQLLDVLDKYNVKVTFFVTNQYPKYKDLIKEEAARGHAVAVHTYSHDYKEIYASEDAFYKDIDKMQEIIKEQTGSTSQLLRFPGGSSNTVSRHYCEGIMTTLSKSVGEHGYTYFDWNVTSGDAGETTSADQVYKNVIAGCAKHDNSVVLQHDIKGFSVEAVEKIIQWGLENGYTFKTLDVNSPTAHQSIGN